ncbi:short-chain dehydrogenase [Phlyctema vagabunda]|uniref:Short-chain dehydrogenase n=1 Tax=Phlyctema vagabunda TaxID=108571 RepID=A0ABR4P1R5_9HELO
MIASKDMPALPKNFAKVFWNNQFRVRIPLPTRERFSSLKGKVAIVTGANSGLGFESARQLLALGLSHLVVAVRSIEKGNAAAARLRQPYPEAIVHVWFLDMESYDSIQAFVRRCESELPRIDYAILNAGLAPVNFDKSRSTGHEVAMQVNHISTALLTMLLLPVFTAKSVPGNPVRLTVINSIMAHLSKFPNRDQRPLLPSFDNTDITRWEPSERYGVSKLLAQLFLVKLTELIKTDHVIINMVDPGLTKGTDLAREARGALWIASKAFSSIAGRPVDRGAATYIDALLGHGRESHGCFLMNTQVSPLAAFYYTTDGRVVQEQVWKETLEELKFAHVEEILASLT